MKQNEGLKENMLSKKVRAVTVCKLFISLLAVAGMLAVWPFGVIRYTCEERGYPEEFQYSLPLITDHTVQEYFTPKYDYLESIVVNFAELPEHVDQGVIHMNLLDASGNLLKHSYIPMSSLLNGYNIFPMNLQVDTRQTYSYYIYTENMADAAPKLVYRTLSMSGPEENSTFMMNGIPFEDCSAAGGYDYGLPLRTSQILSYDMFLLLCAVLLCQGVELITQKIKSHKL